MSDEYAAEREGEGERANLAVTELLAKLAERTNELQGVQAELAERTNDLQRLQAEFSNYKKRVERDRQAVKDAAVAGALSELLPVLDDIGRAREHGELEGGFRQVGESFEAVVAKLGLVRFGAAGEVFDPNLHEALMSTTSPDVDEVTVATLFRPGYRIGERIVRPAQVQVAEPGPAPEAEEVPAPPAPAPASASASSKASGESTSPSASASAASAKKKTASSGDAEPSGSADRADQTDQSEPVESAPDVDDDDDSGL
ncbi:MAG: nucleotide exchange factor GrpE [Catenulisporales bacterium]|nr:nucleotide exchange factor GrpE [Catenulisporales bacterium]